MKIPTCKIQKKKILPILNTTEEEISLIIESWENSLRQ